jgi:hypothetical protein
MLWLVEKVARFKFRDSYRIELPPASQLMISGDGRVAQWEGKRSCIESTFKVLRERRLDFQESVLRQLDVQRAYSTLDPFPFDGDQTTSQVWSALGWFLLQFPMEDGVPRAEFLRMHFDKVRRSLKHIFASENFHGILDDLERLDFQITENIERARIERYLASEHINDAAEILVHVLRLLNHDRLGGSLWSEISQNSPRFFLKTLGHCLSRSGPTLQRDTLQALRAEMEKAWRRWGDYLPDEHSYQFRQFLAA